MTKRTDIIEGLIEAIEATTLSPGTRGLRFLDEVNEFPAFYVHTRQEGRTHISAGVKYANMEIDIRGYIHSDELASTELYIRQIEEGVQALASTCVVDEARVLSVRTDEGLMLPYSVCDLQIQIIYIV